MSLPPSSIDLRQYSDQITAQISQTQLTIRSQCSTHQSDIKGLYTEVSQAVTTLGKLECVLTNFQEGLSSISSEITEMQQMALKMSESVGRRKELDTSLKDYLEGISLSPCTIAAINSAPIDLEYVKQVKLLQDKLTYVLNRRFEAGESIPLSMQEVIPDLKLLNQKATFRVRNFFLSHFNNMTKSGVDIRTIQENALLKHKDLVIYLRDCGQTHYADLCQNYLEAINKIYNSYFKFYTNTMKRLILDQKMDLVVPEESRGFFSSSVMQAKPPCFDLGNRHKVLEQMEVLPSVITKSTLRSGEKYPLERVFQSLIRLLVDASSFAYFFILDFFAVSPEQFQSLFPEFFKPIFTSTLETLSQVTLEHTDVFSLLLMLRITDNYRILMSKRRIHALDSFFDQVKSLLWPRSTAILDAHHRSLDSGKVRVTDISPHPAASRFCQLAKALNALGMENDMFTHRFNILKKSMVGLLERAAVQLRDLKNRSVFLINNLDYILEDLTRENVESAFFESAFRSNEAQFIELQLAEVFGMLLDFIDAAASKKSIDQRQVELLQGDLKLNWKKGLSLIQTIERDLFTSENCQREVLRETYTRLMIRYTDYCDVVKGQYPALVKDLVTVQTLMQEVRVLNN